MSILKAFLYTILIVVFYGIIQLVIYLPFKDFIGKIELNSSVFGLIDIVSRIGSFLLIYFFIWKPKLDFKKALSFKTYNPNILLYLPLIAIGYYLTSKPFWDYKLILEHYQSVFTNNDIKPTGNTIYYILTTVIVSPIIEELFYRKFLLKKLTNKYNLTTALIISSFCFSIIHIQTPNNLITAFIVGIIFGLIYMHTKKIGYTIILHTIINIIIIIPNNIGYSYDNWFFGTKFDGIYWLLFIIGIMITYLGVYKILKAKQNNIRD